MKSRVIAGLLALFLGTFGIQKFYLGRKKEAWFSLLFCWTWIPAFLGICEGLWILGRSESQWADYLRALQNPKWYSEPAIARLYFYPLWFAAILIGIIFLASHGLGPTLAINVASPIHVTQTWGVYELQVDAPGASRVLIDAKTAEALGEGAYRGFVLLSAQENRIKVYAFDGGRSVMQEVVIIRPANDAELAKEKAEKLEADKKISQKQAEDAKCMRDSKCRKQREQEARLQNLAKVDERLTQWIGSNELTAYEACKKSVKLKLLSPSSASFPWGGRTIWAAGWFVYVHSYVDAENGFGAQIRSNFTCKLQLRADELSLVDISLN